MGRIKESLVGDNAGCIKLKNESVEISASMLYTLDDVVQTAASEFQLAPAEGQRQQYLQFSRWFIEQYSLNLNNHQTRNSEHAHAPYFRLAVDAVCLYSCLAGLRPVYDDKYDLTHTAMIDAEEKLLLLRSRGNVEGLWTDATLGRLCQRRESAKSKSGLPGYKELLTMVGKYPLLVERWGREIVYERDVRLKKK